MLLPLFFMCFFMYNYARLGGDYVYSKLLKLSMLLVLILMVTACTSKAEDEAILNKSDQDESVSKIIFGNKIGEKELTAKNIFSTSETAHFIINSKQEFGLDTIQVIVNSNNGNGWEELTSSTLDVEADWTQAMNGLPSAFLEQIGPGAFQMVAKVDGETIAKGEFVIEQKE